MIGCLSQHFHLCKACVMWFRRLSVAELTEDQAENKLDADKVYHYEEEEEDWISSGNVKEWMYLCRPFSVSKNLQGNVFYYRFCSSVASYWKSMVYWSAGTWFLNLLLTTACLQYMYIYKWSLRFCNIYQQSLKWYGTVT